MTTWFETRNRASGFIVSVRGDRTSQTKEEYEPPGVSQAASPHRRCRCGSSILVQKSSRRG
jgi:hypothetical protein